MVVKNYLYNLVYQLLTILSPIITIPYVSRILGAEGIGKYSLTNTYAQYFVLFGMIGLGMYCSREVAYVRDNKKRLSELFWELNLLRFITMGISLIIYIIFFTYIIGEDDRIISIIQGLILLSSMFDISWLYVGLEDFKKVSIRNSIVKIAGVCLVFIFVKNESHVWLYSLILGGTQFIGQVIMWFDIPKEIKFILPKKEALKRHLLFSIKLFIPQIAINIYTMLDKVMLGNLVNESEVGMYDNSQKIIKIAITIVTTIASVTTPKMVNLYKNKQLSEFSSNVYKSFSFVSFLAFPMAFGLVGTCKNFIPWFYGRGFERIELMFYFGAWLMISLAWSSIVGTQVLLSTKRDKKFTIAVTIGALTNVIINIILINKLGGVGTTISSIIAEFIVTFVMVYFIKDLVEVRKLFKVVPKYLISAFIMFVIVLNVGNLLNPNIWGTFIQVSVGILSYISIMIILKDENLLYIIKFIEEKVKFKEITKKLA